MPPRPPRPKLDLAEGRGACGRWMGTTTGAAATNKAAQHAAVSAQQGASVLRKRG
jgi:hypothetical protein